MNKSLLESVMKKYGDTQETLAIHMGISRTRLNMKINETDGATFTQPEIAVIKRKYGLNADDVDSIFFDIPVSQKDTNSI